VKCRLSQGFPWCGREQGECRRGEQSTVRVAELWITVCVSGSREQLFSRLDHLAHSMSTCEPESSASI